MEAEDNANQEDLYSDWTIFNNSLTLCASEEARVIQKMNDAGKGKAIVFNLSVQLRLNEAPKDDDDSDNKSGGSHETGVGLGIGVRLILDKILIVSMLYRHGHEKGVGETAGLRLGDVIFGANFQACRDTKSVYTEMLAASETKSRNLTLQCWRCLDLCADELPSHNCIISSANSSVIKAYDLLRNVKGSAVFSRTEMWNFVQIILIHLQNYTACLDMEGIDGKSTREVVAELVDMERNLLCAKGLRMSLNVRVLSFDMDPKGTLFTFRCEDVETGALWVVKKKYADFSVLNEELNDIFKNSKEVLLPHSWMSLLSFSFSVQARIEQIREQASNLETYVCNMLQILQIYAPSDAKASKALRRLQNFLNVGEHIDCIRPLRVDPQREIELLAYHVLNDRTSPLAITCTNFVQDWAPEMHLSDGVRDHVSHLSALKHLAAAMRETEERLWSECGALSIDIISRRRPDLSVDQRRLAVRRCLRRQVELVVYLPCRRRLWVLCEQCLEDKMIKLQENMQEVANAPLNVLGISENIVRAPSLPRAVKAMRDAVNATLPIDQLLLLEGVASLVVAVHRESSKSLLGSRRLSESNPIHKEHETPDALTFQAKATSSAMSADDFIPIFTYVLSQITIPHLAISKDILVCLTDEAELLEETGYYMATLEAATAQMGHMAKEKNKLNGSGSGSIDSIIQHDANCNSHENHNRKDNHVQNNNQNNDQNNNDYVNEVILDGDNDALIVSINDCDSSDKGHHEQEIEL
jgi:hypothetical protein